MRFLCLSNLSISLPLNNAGSISLSKDVRMNFLYMLWLCEGSVHVPFSVSVWVDARDAGPSRGLLTHTTSVAKRGTKRVWGSVDRSR